MLSKEIFARKLKCAIDEKGITQANLAETINTSAANISNYVKAKAFPPVDVLVELAEALGKSLDWLCDREKQENNFINIENFGNAVQVLEQLQNCAGVYMTHVTNTRTIVHGNTPDEAEFEDIQEVFPALVFCGGELLKYLDDKNKMQKLLNDRTIDETLFDRWNQDRLSALGRIPVSSQCFIPDSALCFQAMDDGDLPF